MAQQFPDVRFPGWEVIRKLGEGSFGGVYEIHRTLPDGRVEKAALKKLTVPKDNSEIRELYSQSFSNADPVFRACVSLVPEDWDFRTCWCGKAPVFIEIKAKGGNLRV